MKFLKQRSTHGFVKTTGKGEATNRSVSPLWSFYSHHY